MKMSNYHIIPYTEDFLPSVTELEKGILQGKNIKLELVKDHFLSRAKVFKDFYPCIALFDEKQVIGLAIGARTQIIINGSAFDAGVGFDTKTSTDWRNKGVGRMLAKYIYKHFFIPQGLKKNFITAKKSNMPVLKLVSRAIPNVWVYDFVYLTIPTSNRIKTLINPLRQLQQFSVSFFNKEEVQGDYYSENDNGLGYFHTHKMYRLKIKRINSLYKKCIFVLKKFFPEKYKSLPVENEVISFATLYNHTCNNITGINTILEELEKQGLKYLLVCCKKHDPVYKYLITKSINTYSYYLMSDFNITNKDNLAIDVRCL